MIASKTKKRKLKKIEGLLKAQLQKGLSHKQLALASALGATIGIMPLVWGTSLLCLFLAWIFKLNQAVVQSANYLAYPFQIMLFIPYLVGGARLFATMHVPQRGSIIMETIQSNPELFFHDFWQLNLQALALWFMTTPIFFCLFTS